MTAEKYRVLVVDDDGDFRKYIVQLLEEAGHDVCEAANGLLALQALGEHEVDIMITEIIMPVMEGIETIRTVRREFPDIKIIAVSGGGHGEVGFYLDLAAAMGAHRIFTKPFEPSTLLNAIDQLGKSE